MYQITVVSGEIIGLAHFRATVSIVVVVVVIVIETASWGN